MGVEERKARSHSGQYISKREVARLLGLSIYTIDSWVSQRREIPFIRMGSRVKFDLRDVTAWLERNRHVPQSD
jgi:excisionase family DNA binding protein